MLINISYKNGLFYIWGVTDRIDSNDGQKYIEAETKILRSIAEKCTAKKTYVSNAVSINVELPVDNGYIDVTGKSNVFETFTTNAFTIPINKFLAYAPTRIKKEFPKKTFVNVHLSNGFVLTHLLMRIVNELFEAREYYPYLHVDDNQNLMAKWRARLNGNVEFYIRKIIHSLPQTFFILSEDDQPNYYAFVREMIDDAMQAYMAFVAGRLDKRKLKKRSEWPIIEQ
ncbi:MAG: hypothetical protein Q8K36_04370, partial [Alphaproteobacteria bacterium]|nr:hypothetical protein [Alphaproteobacteria bacterium]